MKNVILIGFMGTGKTSTGKMLASKLGCAFIDMDQKIEEEAGKRIPEIFAQQGEAHFRQLERDLVERLSARRNAVFSPAGKGNGALLGSPEECGDFHWRRHGQKS